MPELYRNCGGVVPELYRSYTGVLVELHFLYKNSGFIFTYLVSTFMTIRRHICDSSAFSRVIASLYVSSTLQV